MVVIREEEMTSGNGGDPDSSSIQSSGEDVETNYQTVVTLHKRWMEFGKVLKEFELSGEYLKEYWGSLNVDWRRDLVTSLQSQIKKEEDRLHKADRAIFRRNLSYFTMSLKGRKKSNPSGFDTRTCPKSIKLLVENFSEDQRNVVKLMGFGGQTAFCF